MKITRTRAYAEARAKGKSPKEALKIAKQREGEQVYAFYPDIWRHLRRGFSEVWNPPFKAYGSNHCRWIEKPEQAGLRYVGAAHELARMVHTGFYLDGETPDETVHGVVYQMPARNVRARYVPGYADPWQNGPALLCFDEIFEGEPDDEFNIDAKREAALRADETARIMAKREREYQFASRRGFAYLDAGEQISTVRASIRESIRELRQLCPQLAGFDALRARLRQSIESDLHRVQELRQERAELIEEAGHLNGFEQC